MGKYGDYMGHNPIGRIECRRGNNRGNEPVTIGDGECTRETDKAILVELKSDRKDAFGFKVAKELWLPKSVLHDDSEVFELHGTGSVVIKRYWAEQEGLPGV